MLKSDLPRPQQGETARKTPRKGKKKAAKTPRKKTTKKTTRSKAQKGPSKALPAEPSKVSTDPAEGPQNGNMGLSGDDTPQPAKRKRGRPRKYSDADAARRRDQSKAAYDAKQSKNKRDIWLDADGEEIWRQLIEGINWERRLACKRNLRLFNETYLPNVFSLGWADNHLRCIRKMETVFLDGGMFALAMPRGGGKTAMCRGSMLWGTGYAHRVFPFFIGASAKKATQTLDFIKTYWYMSQALRQDFPEIAYPIRRIENRAQLATGQIFRGESTHVEWGADSVRYPCILLPRELGELYERQDPESVQWLKEYQAYLPSNAGVIIRTAGIDGSIRGDADVHPITLTQPRPDVALLDDVQKDQGADSPTTCDKLIAMIDGAVQGLAGPGERIAALMPNTVIREGDVSDTYLDRTKKPEWGGERCALVNSWPPGISDVEITLETEAGKHWTQYGEERRKSYRLYDDIRLATEYYRKHREIMDDGFVCSWDERYDSDTELSAQQHAMNLRLSNPITFLAEYQNKPRRYDHDNTIMISADDLAKKTVGIKRRHLAPDAHRLVAFIDVQNEILFYSVLAVNMDFTGNVVDYGTWPHVGIPSFQKHQVEGWSLLTTEFFKAYPQHRDKAIKTEGGKVRAPLDAKIYFALTKAVNHLLKLRFTRDMDGIPETRKVERIGIDTRWGKASEFIKQYCRECGHREVVPYTGQAFLPSHKQLEEYVRTTGWLFEDQVNPSVKEVKWVFKPMPDGYRMLQCDVSRMKTFLMKRLASPPGASGSISLFDAPAEAHEMFARHICESEYPEPLEARGMKKDLWRPRSGNPDNDYLDTVVGCCALASMLGASVKTGEKQNVRPKRRRKLSELWKRKRQGGK
jgi:hypothetical protein